jgi:predicted metalloprotease with PDZ domain
MRLPPLVALGLLLIDLLPAQAKTLGLLVDASDITQNIVHVKMSIPAQSKGDMVLVYPKWIPGAHMPMGPINDLVGLRFSADGVTIPWRRDSVDMFAFHLDVPAGQANVEATFDVVITTDGSGPPMGIAAAREQMVLDWYQVVLYPAGLAADAITIASQLTLPAAWNFGTALPVHGRHSNTVIFEPITLATLIDSPVLAGAHLRDLDITPPGEHLQHRLDLVSESQSALEIPVPIVESYRRLVEETGALFGARHYGRYVFLVWLYGTTVEGIEHHESSDIRLPENALVDSAWLHLRGDLLAHEMVHSWNGKYRRPEGLTTRDYQQPMKGDLLWIYEGLTNYLGFVLAARSGIWSPTDFRSRLALIAAKLDNRPGRTWRPLQDTATAGPIVLLSSPQWSAWRRSGGSPDFYDEGTLLWLEVDTIIRSRTNGQKSLDDFCRAFFGGEATAATVVPYSVNDVIGALNNVVRFDWRTLFQERLSSLASRAPLDGIVAAGWQLRYGDRPSELFKLTASYRGQLDLQYSLGMLMQTGGTIVDVIPGTPAARAGLAPGMNVVAVNGRRFSPQALRDGLRHSQPTSAPLVLLVNRDDDFMTLNVDYHGGERYPCLERDETKPDLLSTILSPAVPKVADWRRLVQAPFPQDTDFASGPRR